eukprot:CAMPEP_0206386852 /NCGR_PEP_ID=MMETSP0294-20121207/16216_1 /ASSEMBLY_ACC=CAM_ASM_000327 /TAXON_ID=39354 /ORGANISM="Heterosigma akashiwo, Strain CCMP2393" /LENGTH=804 /DNA_ID=CAMNT_0053838031 /DNA_START=96 /DNA_END=2510 /DNA_ORIENTATION=+
MTLLKKKRKLKEKFVDEEKEIEEIEERIRKEAPPPGSMLTTNEDGEEINRFDQLPLSYKTKKGLKANNFEKMTDIQKMALPHCLAGRDILGAARTGSGKTLAFLVPVLETLYRQRWTAMEDGLGALIVSPTRELALQIFDVLRKVGRAHALSAGLVTGGKREFREEQARVGRMAVLVATPGRALQHLEQTSHLNVDNLQVLVLDEADRLLDMGFQRQLDALVGYLPAQRQTLLFSATQTKSVKDLSRLSLKDPEYVGVHDRDATATPRQLQQMVAVCRLPDKFDLLFSFVRSHLKSKMIVFLSTCSQVRYADQLFCKLRPGLPVLALHGKLKQVKRSAVYFDFLKRPAALLFATDVAARGLDFPAVDWVLQVDCPEDKAMYIHRVGRTARYKSGGKALTLLLESEAGPMREVLKEAKIPVKTVQINPAKATSIAKKAAAMVASDAALKLLAQKAFKSYLRSVMLMPNQEVFRVSALPVPEYAAALGLATVPPTKFLRDKGGREAVRATKNKSRALQKLKEEIKEEKMKKRLETSLSKVEAQSGPEKGRGSSHENKESSESEDDLLVVKKKHDFSKDDESDEETVPEMEKGKIERKKSKKKEKKLKIKLDKPQSLLENKKIVFNEDGEAIHEKGVDELFDDIANDEINQTKFAQKADEYSQKIKEKLVATKERDLELARERVREKHVKKRQKKKGPRAEEDDDGGGGGAVVTLAGGESSDNEEGGGGGGRGAASSAAESSDEEEASSYFDRGGIGSDESLNDYSGGEEQEENPRPSKKKRRQKPATRPSANEVLAQEEAILKMLS